MDAIEKRALDQLAQLLQSGGFDGELRVGREFGKALVAEIAALTPSEGHVVVTRNEAGQAVAVTRQDDEGRILSVIAEFGPPEGYVPERSVLVAATRLRKLASAAHPMARSAYIKAAEMVEMAVIAARPEVP